MTSDADIADDLRRLFSAFDIAEQSRMPLKAHTFTEASDGDSQTQTVSAKLNDENLLRYDRNIEVMLQCCGFVVERRPSSLLHGGTGVVVTHGTIRAGVVTSLYPGIASYCVGMISHLGKQDIPGVGCVPTF